MVVVAQLVRASVCGTEGRRFESGLPPKRLKVFHIRLQAVSSYFETAFFMSKFKQFLLNEYGNEYDFRMKKQYSEPKIYDANGNLSKRWYVYFSFRNPNTNKLERQKPIYVSLLLKSKKDRMVELKVYQSSLSKMLEKGFSPYDNNNFESDDKLVTTRQAIEFALKIKSNTLNSGSYRKYESRINQFLTYTEKIGYDVRSVLDLNKKIVNAFLNDVLDRTSPSNRNNSRREISSLFNILVENEILQHNYVEGIKKIKTQPKKNRAYTDKEADDIFAYLEDKDKNLLLFLKFVTYGFLRPIEVCRLQVRDIDLLNNLMVFKAKNKPTKTKILIDILIKELHHFKNYDPKFYLFTPTGEPGLWERDDEGKREFFTKKYSKIKTSQGFSSEYGIYSFRHTFTVRIYRKLRETLTPDEAESKLMMITGHATRGALRKYLREIDAELPGDYSDLIS